MLKHIYYIHVKQIVPQRKQKDKPKKTQKTKILENVKTSKVYTIVENSGGDVCVFILYINLTNHLGTMKQTAYIW